MDDRAWLKDVEDLAHHRRVEQEGENPHLSSTLGTGERVDLVGAAD
jgi:hypothetical protein